jgi:hypothetical protein
VGTTLSVAFCDRCGRLWGAALMFAICRDFAGVLLCTRPRLDGTSIAAHHLGLAFHAAHPRVLAAPPVHPIVGDHSLGFFQPLSSVQLPSQQLQAV